MNGFVRQLTAALLLSTSSLLQAGPAAADDRTDIGRLLETYERALNAGDAAAILPLYDDDGVFMAQHSKPSVGRGAVAKAYDAVFQAIDLEIDFIVDEIVLTGEGWAFARTRSEGSVTLQHNGVELPEANQELFLLRKREGAWKIARYIFSTTKPLP